MNSTRSLPGFVVLVAALGLILPGCTGEKLAKVSGTVTFKDKKLSGGTVVFANEDNSKVEHTPIGLDGTYSSSRVPFGQLRVGVEPATKGITGNLPKGAKPKGPPKDEKVPDVYEKKNTGEYVDIPKELRDPTTSKMTLNVDSAEKTFDIVLPSGK